MAHCANARALVRIEHIEVLYLCLDNYTQVTVVCEKDCAVIGTSAKAQNADNAAHWRGFVTQAGGLRPSNTFANHCYLGIKLLITKHVF